MGSNRDRIGGLSIRTECGLRTIDDVNSNTSPTILAKDIHSLDQTTKESLLNWTKSNIESAKIESTALLDTLKRIAPSIADTLYVKHDSVQDLILRLYNPDRSDGNIETSYIALSYCWKGKREENVDHHVSIEGRLPVPTSSDMFKMVMAQKRSAEEGLWYDQGCINQQDDQEKAIAIGLMDRIYQNARSVIVALDDIELNQQEVMYLEAFTKQYATLSPAMKTQVMKARPPWLQTSPYSSVMRSIYDKILESSLMDRAWCGHEMRLASNLVFLVRCVQSDHQAGKLTYFRFGEGFLYWLLELGIALTTAERNMHKLANSRERDLYGFLIARYRDNVVQKNGKILGAQLDSRAILDTMNGIFDMGASGSPLLSDSLRHFSANKDKLSIMLNITGLGLALKGTTLEDLAVLTREECYRRLSLIALAAGDLRVLGGFGSYLQPGKLRSTWLTRPTAGQPAPKNIASLPEGSHLSIGVEDDHEYIELNILFFRALPGFKAMTISQESISRATKIFDLCFGHDTLNWPREVYISTIACFIQCGKQWMFDVMKNTKVDPGEVVEWSEFLDHSSNLDHVAARAKQVVFVLAKLLLHVNFGSPKNWQATLWTADVNGSNEVIFAYVPPDHKESLELAIPDLMTDIKWRSLRCAWVLSRRRQPAVDDSTDWSLLGKTPFLCRPALEEALTSNKEMHRDRRRIFATEAVVATNEDLYDFEMPWMGSSNHILLSNLFADITAPQMGGSSVTTDTSRPRGNFTATSIQVSLDSQCNLIAWCKNSQSETCRSILNINNVLGNGNGEFQWVKEGGTGNFKASARNITLSEDGSLLKAELCDSHGNWKQSQILLDDRITNMEGQLRYLQI